MNLGGLARPQKPTVVTADGTALKIGTILGIFPLEELAPIKFEHRPKFWLRIAPQEPEVGEIIALVPIDIKGLMNAEVPPTLGQVMAKRTESTANLRLCPFKRVLSLGLAGPLEQSAMTLPGSFAINRHGTLVAVYAGIQMIRNQALRFVAPVADLREQIDKLADFQPEAKEPKARQAFQFVARATLLLVDRDIEGTVRELEAAVKLSPPDYPGNREKLAKMPLHLMRPEDAEQLYKEAYAAAPESLELIEEYKDALIALRKYDEFAALVEKGKLVREIYWRTLGE